MREELLRIEHELGGGNGDAYRRHLTEDAVVIVPGAVMDREQCAQAIDAGGGWDEFSIDDAHVLELSPDSAVLTYRWHSRRGDSEYAAAMSSVYTRRDGTWRLVLHQQTPEG